MKPVIAMCVVVAALVALAVAHGTGGVVNPVAEDGA